MTPDISERAFEAAIECALLRGGPDACPGDVAAVRESPPTFGDDPGPGGYHRRRPDDYDRSLCLIPADVVDFLFAVVRPLRFSEQDEQSVDLTLFLNGIPIFTAELKNLLNGQDVQDAIRQYREDRDPREPLFAYARCLAHFAVDPEQVFVTTCLAGPKTRFLPFNRGRFGGAGNPAVPPTRPDSPPTTCGRRPGPAGWTVRARACGRLPPRDEDPSPPRSARPSPQRPRAHRPSAGRDAPPMPVAGGPRDCCPTWKPACRLQGYPGRPPGPRAADGADGVDCTARARRATLR